MRNFIRAYDDKYHAALTVMWGKFHDVCIAGEPRLSAAEREIAELRVWVKTLGWLDRRAYTKWLDFYANGIKRRRKEINDSKRRDSLLARGEFPQPKRRS